MAKTFQKLSFTLAFVFSIFISSCGSANQIPDPPNSPHSRADQSSPSITTVRPSSALPVPSVRFEHLSVEDGLAHSEITAIIQDELGFMWFGTQNGLSKFDGHLFTTFRHDAEDKGSLRDNFIESLHVDSNGILWVGTQDGWLERYDRSSGSFTHFKISSHVYTISGGEDGKLWIGSKNPGLLRFDPTTGETQTFWDIEDVLAVVIDSEGSIWAASPDGGLGRLDPTNNQLMVFTPEFPVSDLVMDDNGNLWIGTYGGGLGSWVDDARKIEFTQHDPNDTNSPANDYISALHMGNDNTLWIGTFQRGFDRLDLNTGAYAHFSHDPTDSSSLSRNLVLSLYQDHSGILWIGSGVGGGVNRLTVDAERFGHYRPLEGDPNSLSSALVTSITGDGDTIWIGTFTGLNLWDQETGLWINYNNDPDDPGSLINDSVRSVYIDSRGDLWVGTEGGLDRYDPTIDGFIHHGGPVVMWMHEGPSGRLWMATKSGFFKFDRSQGEFILIDEGYAWKIMVLEDDSGRVWVGSSGDGASLYDPTSDTWTHFQPEPENATALSNGFVEAIIQDNSGRVWFGTGDGLNLFDEQSGTFTRYQTKDGLQDDRIAGLLEDDQGYLWLATNGGLARFDPNTESFEIFTEQDGLQSNIFWRNAYFKGTDGEIFFGGDNGLNAFYPENIVANPQVPPVVITSVSLFNQSIMTDFVAGESLTLKYDENFLSFDFVALDYTDPDQNQYTYQLIGLDQDWVQAGNRRHADYPNLRPGEYTFRVIGSNNDGVWNNVGASVAITVQPPFWQTPWFIGLVIVGLIGVGYSAYRIRVRSLEHRGQELEAEVTARTRELQEANVQLEHEMRERERAEEALADAAAQAAVREERDRLARDLHDSVTQSIYSTTLLSEAGQRHAAGGDLDQSRSTFQRLGQITQQALKEMRLLVYELRPVALEEAGLVDALQTRLDAVERRAGVDARLIVEDDIVLEPNCEAALYYLAHEALNNALKHAAPEKVVVQLESIESGGYRITISDDGIGFETGTVEHGGGLGLVSMRERVDALHGTFTIKSAPGEGTTIIIALPLDLDGEP